MFSFFTIKNFEATWADGGCILERKREFGGEGIKIDAVLFFFFKSSI